MISRQEHDKKMADIQEQIDYAHSKLRQHADDTLKRITDNYQSKLLEKVADELELAKHCTERGDDRQAGQHMIRAEVYRSAYDAIKAQG